MQLSWYKKRKYLDQLKWDNTFQKQPPSRLFQICVRKTFEIVDFLTHLLAVFSINWCHKELRLRSCGSPRSTSRTLWRILNIVQVLKLSKIAGLQFSTLLKMNYFTGCFKLPEWLHSYHHVSCPITQSIPRLWLRGNASTLYVCSLLQIYHICTIQQHFDFSLIFHVY